MNYLNNMDTACTSAIEHLRAELAKLQTGRASAALVEHVLVESYGAKQPLKNIASISIPDAQSIQIQPWDKSMLSAIEKGIQTANIGLSPVNDGISIRLAIPPLSEERRKEMCKMAKQLGEDGKISIRTARQNELKHIKASTALTEDERNKLEKQIQEKVDKANKTLEEIVEKKEKDIMTI